MDYPQILKLASLPTAQLVKINESTTLKKQVYNSYDDVLARVMAEKLGFLYEIVAPRDNREYGSLMPNGNWSGLVGMLQRNEADLIINMLSITEKRREVIDYSYPYHVDRLVFATRNLAESVHQNSFLEPFAPEVWVSLLVFLSIIPLTYSILFQRRQSCQHFQGSFRRFMRRSRTVPRSGAECCLRICSLVLQTLLRWSYASVLLSFLTFPSLTGVRNIPELANAVRAGSYQCTAYPGAFYADYLLNSSNSDLRIIGQSLKQSDGHKYFYEVLNNDELQMQPAYISTEGRFMGITQRYFVSADGFFPDYRAVGINKHFCCKSDLDRLVHKIWASGIYAKIRRDVIFKEVNKILWNSSDIYKEKRLSMEDFEGIFFFLLAGFLLAFIALIFELIITKTEVIIKLSSSNCISFMKGPGSLNIVPIKTPREAKSA